MTFEVLMASIVVLWIVRPCGLLGGL